MVSMTFVFRPSTKAGDHPGSISLRVIYQRRVKVVTLSDCRLYPQEWDKRTRSIIYPENDPRRSKHLEKIELKMKNEMEIFRSLALSLEKKGYYEIHDIMECYFEKRHGSALLGFSETLAKRLERRGQGRTANAYRTVSRGLIGFNRGKDIPLNRINACLIKEFENSLKARGRLPNTISYYMRNLRAIYNKAIELGLIVGSQKSEKPFTGVYTGVTKTRKRALTLEETRNLYNIDFSCLLEKGGAKTKEQQKMETLFIAWRMFFFCLYARGMSFIDMAYLRKDNIRGGVMKYCRKKTGQQIEVRLTPELWKIINSFADETFGTPYVFPVIKEYNKNDRLQYENGLKQQNQRLKALSRLAGIKPVSTHVARHTWATIGKQRNVPLQVISECLGHTSETTTLIYLGLLDGSVLDEANEAVVSAIAR